MEDTSGFYKIQNQNGEIILIYGPNGVMYCNYDLLKENHKNYNYPIDGWRWFDSQAEAKAFFGIVDEPQTPQI